MRAVRRPPLVERHDRQLIRRVRHELLRRRVDHGFGVNYAGPCFMRPPES